MASAAQANFFAGAAMMVFGFAFKLIARTPIPGRLRTVGNALKTARSGLKNATGAAFASVKRNLLGKLREARGGMPELLKAQGGEEAALATRIETMDASEFVDKLASGDPALAELDVEGVNGQKLVNEYYEASFQQIVDEGCTLYGVDIGSMYATEIDTIDDLMAANARLAQRPAFDVRVDGVRLAV